MINNSRLVVDLVVGVSDLHDVPAGIQGREQGRGRLRAGLLDQRLRSTLSHHLLALIHSQ